MRSDMKDVIIDTARHRSMFRKGRPAKDPEDMISGKVSIRRHVNEHGELAEFGDRIRPLQRFLRSRVGQRWDDVYSEICSEADGSNIRGYHLRLHLNDLVEHAIDVEKDGKPIYPEGAKSWVSFFVYNGILREVKPRSWKRPKAKSKIVEMGGSFYYQHDDVWYQVRKEPIPKRTFKIDYSTPKTRTASYLRDYYEYYAEDDFGYSGSEYSRNANVYGESVKLFKIKQCDSQTCKKIRKQIEKDSL